MTDQNARVALVWSLLQERAADLAGTEPVLASFLKRQILAPAGFAESLALLLSGPVADAAFSASDLGAIFLETYRRDPALLWDAARDLDSITSRDPAAPDSLIPYLFFKGFHALQTHRVAHALWKAGRVELAAFLQYRTSLLYGVDIHPAAQLGNGIFIDHATGLVIGETAVVEDDVSFLHGVTLGGTGKEKGDRHPKVRRGVMLGAGATVLGNIEIGHSASVAAGSVVLKSVPPRVTVAGVPAQIVGTPRTRTPAEEMDQTLPE